MSNQEYEEFDNGCHVIEGKAIADSAKQCKPEFQKNIQNIRVRRTAQVRAAENSFSGHLKLTPFISSFINGPLIQILNRSETDRNKHELRHYLHERSLPLRITGTSKRSGKQRKQPLFYYYCTNIPTIETVIFVR